MNSSATGETQTIGDGNRGGQFVLFDVAGNRLRGRRIPRNALDRD